MSPSDFSALRRATTFGGLCAIAVVEGLARTAAGVAARNLAASFSPPGKSSRSSAHSSMTAKPACAVALTFSARVPPNVTVFVANRRLHGRACLNAWHPRDPDQGGHDLPDVRGLSRFIRCRKVRTKNSAAELSVTSRLRPRQRGSVSRGVEETTPGMSL